MRPVCVRLRRAAALAAAIAAGAAPTGCDRAREAEAASTAAVEDPGPARAVTAPALTDSRVAAVPGHRTVAAAAQERITRALRLDSHLLVERDVAVMARRDGFVEAIHADRGGTVKEGDLLATLEHGDLLVGLKGAMLELEKEQASFERSAKLLEQSIVPAEEFEQARLRRDAAATEVDRIKYEIEKCKIRAPFDGVVSGRFVEKGQVIKEDDARTLFQVTALGPLLARVYLPEWALFGVRVGTRVMVTPGGIDHGSDGSGASPIEARIRWINHVVDAASGSAEMLVEVPDGPSSSTLRPGMSVEVRIDLTLDGRTGAGGATPRRIVSLPKEALGPVELVPGRWLELKVLAPDGTAAPRRVQIGFVGDDRMEVRRGLAAGEKVVTGSATAAAAPDGP